MHGALASVDSAEMLGSRELGLGLGWALSLLLRLVPRRDKLLLMLLGM